MDLVLHSNKIEEYLKHDDVIDFENEAVSKLADELCKKARSELDFIKAGMDAQFSLETGRLAFAVRPELWGNLPTELEQLK